MQGGEYVYKKAKIKKIIDCNSIVFIFDLGFGVECSVFTKLLNVKAQEISGEERQEELQVLRLIESFLFKNKDRDITVKTSRRDSVYFSDVYIDDIHLNALVNSWAKEARLIFSID